jgi:hypothetical protein
MNLPRDITRCHGVGCALRLNCARHMDLPENTVLSWVETMIELQAPMFSSDLIPVLVPACASFIPWRGDPAQPET